MYYPCAHRRSKYPPLETSYLLTSSRSPKPRFLPVNVLELNNSTRININSSRLNSSNSTNLNEDLEANCWDRGECRYRPRYRRGTAASTMKSEVGAVPGYLSTPLPCQPRVYTRPPPATIIDHAGVRADRAPIVARHHLRFSVRRLGYVRAFTKLRGQRMHGRDLSIDPRRNILRRDAPPPVTLPLYALPFPRDAIFLSPLVHGAASATYPSPSDVYDSTSVFWLVVWFLGWSCKGKLYAFLFLLVRVLGHASREKEECNDTLRVARVLNLKSISE